MFEQKTLEDIIREHIPLGRQDNNGWYPLRCQVCNDHSPRGGFNFSDGCTSYNCFNCATKFRYQEGSGNLSRAAKNILESFGIRRDKLREITSAMFLNKHESEEITLESIKGPRLFTPEVALPDQCYKLLSTDHEDVQEPILNYMLNRNIDPSRVPLMFSLTEKMKDRVIIPYYRDGKVIYWQARHIDNSVKPRYLNCTAKKDAVIYGYDRLYAYEETPLFVTEGVFNAILLNGIAVMSGTLNEARVELLKRSKRRLIFVRDRDKNGDHLAHQAMSHGWEVTTVDGRINDVNDSVTRFGLAYTAYSLMKNIQTTENKVSSSINVNLWGLEDRLKKMRF